MEVPAVEDKTVKVARPVASVVAVAGAIVSDDPRLEVRETVLPETATPESFIAVTVIVEVEVPLATTEVGEAIIVESVVEMEGTEAVMVKLALDISEVRTLSVEVNASTFTLAELEEIFGTVQV